MRVRDIIMAIVAGASLTAGLSPGASAKTTEVAYVQITLRVPEGAQVRQTINKTTRTEDNGHIETGTFQGEYLNRFAPDRDGYRVTKTLVRSSFDLKDNAPKAMADQQPGLEALMQAMAGVGEITYVSDTNLTPLHIHDWPQYRTRIKKALRKAGLMTFRQEEAFDSVYEQVTPEGASELFLPEDAMLAIPHNLGLSLNNPYRLDSKISGPFGGPPISARETLTLTRWDEVAQLAEVTYESGPTPEALAAYARDIRPTLEQIARDEASIDKSAPQPVGDVRLDIATRCVYSVSLTTGLVTRAECWSVRDIRIGRDVRSQREDWVMTESLVTP